MKKIEHRLNEVLKGDGIHYSGRKLLSLTTAKREKPEIIISIGNRSSGKTTYYNSYVLNKALKGKIRSFVYLVRYKYELYYVFDEFFEPIKDFIDVKNFIAGKVNHMGYIPIFFDDKPLFYGVSISTPDQIKKISNVFNSVDMMLWDEFQSEDGKYLPDESRKLQSVHVSIARGNGKSVRKVPLIAVSNAISLLNPLMCSLDCSKNLKSDTKFLRGDNYVLEQNLNTEVMKQQLNSGFNQALKKETDKYLMNDGSLKYLLDNYSDYGKIKGKGKYVCTIKYKDCLYAVRYYTEERKFYVGGNIDANNKNKFASNPWEVDFVWCMPPGVGTMRKFFETGDFVFQDINARNALINFIKY